MRSLIAKQTILLVWVVRPLSFWEAKLESCLCKRWAKRNWVLLEIVGTSELGWWFSLTFFSLEINLPRKLEYSEWLCPLHCAETHQIKSYSLISVFLEPKQLFALQLAVKFFFRFHSINYGFLFHWGSCIYPDQIETDFVS